MLLKFLDGQRLFIGQRDTGTRKVHNDYIFSQRIDWYREHAQAFGTLKKKPSKIYKQNSRVELPSLPRRLEFVHPEPLFPVQEHHQSHPVRPHAGDPFRLFVLFLVRHWECERCVLDSFFSGLRVQETVCKEWGTTSLFFLFFSSFSLSRWELKRGSDSECVRG